MQPAYSYPDQIYPASLEPPKPINNLRYDLGAQAVTWWHNKPSAVSLTFDDGTLDHYLVAFRILEQRKMKGTFFIITDYVDQGFWLDNGQKRELMSWDQIRELAIGGHEIGSHTRTHPKLDSFSLSSWSEIVDSQRQINQQLPEHPCLTFCWPYWHTSPVDERIVSRYYLAARGGGVDIRQYQYVLCDAGPELTDFYRIDSLGVLTNPESLPLFDLLFTACRSHDWAVLCFHGISDREHGIQSEGYAPITSREFEQILDFVKALDSWVAPFATIAKYQSERRLLKVNLMQADGGVLRLVAEDGLDDGIYNQAVTLVVNLPPGWRRVQVEQDKQIMWSLIDGGELYLDIFPDGNPILISRLE